MAVQSVMCGSCGADVPYGRLSCPSCGDLLASVAGRRWPTTAVESVRPIESDGYADDQGADVDGDVDDDDDLDAAAGLDSLWPSATDAWPSATESPPVASTPPPAAQAFPPAAPPPGAYIPPRATPEALAPVAAAAALAQGVPAGPAAPARAWASRPAEEVPAVEAGQPTPAVDAAGRADQARLGEAAGWLTIAGAALTGVGFLMPWSVVVIGSPGTGYLDRWGLAGPGHLVIALAVVAILAVNTLDQVTSRIPVWLRAGIPGLGIGALLLGLVWPYVIGPLGADPGAVVVTVGAFVLVAGGIVGIVADRHARRVPAV